MSQPVLRWAILGTSFISETMMRAIAGSPGSEAVVVQGRDPDRLESFRARHEIRRSTTSLEEAVGDADVDVVYVGLPNHVHHVATVAAARAGKAVLSEKSLTVTTDQADELLDAVTGTVFFVEGLMYLAHPVIARFVEVLRDGRLGALRSVHAGYTADIWQLVNPSGGGAIYDLGCYPASLVQLVVDTMGGASGWSGLSGSFDSSGSANSFGDHAIVASGIVSAHDGNICETAASVRFGSGVIASLHTAETYGMRARFEVHGERGVLAFVTNPWLPVAGENRFDWIPYDGEPEVFMVDDPMDAFDHQVRMVERHVASGALEASRPSPRLVDSRSLIRFLTEWEAAARES